MSSAPTPAPVSPVARVSVEQIGVAVLALAAEVWLVAYGWRADSLGVLLGGHLGIAAVVAAWALPSRQRHSQYGVLLFVATAAFGPLGPAGTLMAIGLDRAHRRHATGIDEWHAMLFPPSEQDEQDDLWRRIGQRATDLPNASQVTPFLDVLTFGTVPQRQAVIAVIVQHFHPAFAPALRAALQDEHNVVRVQAATAIARLEHESLTTTLRLEAALKEAPDSEEAWLAVARHYDDMAFGGLLDATREEESRGKAAEAYTRYLVRRPDDQAVRFRLGRLQLRRGMWAEAEQQFRRLVDAGDGSAAHWLMESLFAQRRYADLRKVAIQARVMDTGPAAETAAPDVAEATAVWTGLEHVA